MSGESPPLQRTDQNQHKHFESDKNLLELHRQCHKRIFEICSKTLETLPVGKDLPRLARKFFLYRQQNEASSNSSQTTTSSTSVNNTEPLSPRVAGASLHMENFVLNNNNKEFTEISFNSSEEDINLTMYELMEKIYTNLSIPSALQFPSLEEYKKEVNSNDHQTITDFLLKHFGQDHPLVRLLKACQQTIVINVLFLARTALMAHQVQFKDVRGQWKLYVYFPSTEASQSPVTDKVLLTQRRRELVYTRRDPSLNKNNSGVFKMFDSLFQIEWEIRIWFQRSTMDVYDVSVHLLDIIYEEPEDTLSDKTPPSSPKTPEEIQQALEKQDQLKKQYAKEAQLISDLFSRINTENVAAVEPKTPTTPGASPRPGHSSAGTTTSSMDNETILIPVTKSLKDEKERLIPKAEAPSAPATSTPAATTKPSSAASAWASIFNFFFCSIPNALAIHSLKKKTAQQSSTATTAPAMDSGHSPATPTEVQPTQITVTAASPLTPTNGSNRLSRRNSIKAWFFEKLWQMVRKQKEEHTPLKEQE